PVRKAGGEELQHVFDHHKFVRLSIATLAWRGQMGLSALAPKSLKQSLRPRTIRIWGRRPHFVSLPVLC
ncbi:MAG: hypothetical protein ACPGWR_13525, partial [Ardenticatenaceae bacterium]